MVYNKRRCCSSVGCIIYNIICIIIACFVSPTNHRRRLRPIYVYSDEGPQTDSRASAVSRVSKRSKCRLCTLQDCYYILYCVHCVHEYEYVKIWHNIYTRRLIRVVAKSYFRDCSDNIIYIFKYSDVWIWISGLLYPERLQAWGVFLNYYNIRYFASTELFENCYIFIYISINYIILAVLTVKCLLIHRTLPRF